MATTTAAPPLVLDVDGTLIRTDLLWEGLLHLCTREVRRVPGVFAAALRGRAALKAYVARANPLSAELIPLEPSALSLISEARAAGRTVVLASGAHETHVAALAARVQADVAWGSTEAENLTGSAKLRRIRAHFPEFDYVGNTDADLPVWAEARKAFALNTRAPTLRRARRLRPDVIVMPSGAPAWRALLRALRPHQWAKNALLLLPPIAAHLDWNATIALIVAAGFLAFSAVASGVYLLNDLIDLPADRVHARKKSRPIPAGEVSIPHALFVAGALIVIAAAIATPLPPAFGAVLLVYFAMTTAYSLVLKRRPLVDVMTLAMLYASRLVAGAALVGVPLSRWFLGFSIFFFLSLALAKRVTELREQMALHPGGGARGYVAEDLPILTSLGSAAAAASSLVYCLYIMDTAVLALYTRPDVLWLGLPILLYWQARVWLLTGRARMNEDPVVFALRDRMSHVLFGAFLMVVVLAS